MAIGSNGSADSSSIHSKMLKSLGPHEAPSICLRQADKEQHLWEIRTLSVPGQVGHSHHLGYIR